MWEVTALTDLTIDSVTFTFNGCGDGSFTLYEKDGTLFGYETNSAAWNIACSGTSGCSWSGNYNANTGSCPISISAGQTKALYLHTTRGKYLYSLFLRCSP